MPGLVPVKPGHDGKRLFSSYQAKPENMIAFTEDGCAVPDLARKADRALRLRSAGLKTKP
jgi:hypothetical protein